MQTQCACDGASRVVASVLPPGVPGATGDEPLVTRTVYDDLGRVTSVTTSEAAGAGSGTGVNLVGMITSKWPHCDHYHPRRGSDLATVINVPATLRSIRTHAQAKGFELMGLVMDAESGFVDFRSDRHVARVTLWKLGSAELEALDFESGETVLQVSLQGASDKGVEQAASDFLDRLATMRRSWS